MPEIIVSLTPEQAHALFESLHRDRNRDYRDRSVGERYIHEALDAVRDALGNELQ